MDIEVGKTYKRKVANGRTATVLYIGDEAVFYRRVTPGESIESSTTIKMFSRFYEEIPAWKPEVGKPAWHSVRQQNVEVLCIYGDYAFCLTPGDKKQPVTLSVEFLREPHKLGV